MWEIFPSDYGCLKGKVRAPSSKSHSLRALLFALCATGPSEIKGLLDSADVQKMISILQNLGGRVEFSKECVVFPPKVPLWEQQEPLSLDCGNSGIAWRFVTALCAIRKGPTLLHGDRSLHLKRPLQALQSALMQLSMRSARLGPDRNKGPIVLPGVNGADFGDLFESARYKSGLRLNLEGNLDSQPVSAALLLMSLIRSNAFGKEREIIVKNPSEVPWIQLSCDWMRFMGICTEFKEMGEGSLSITMEVKRAKECFGSWPGFKLSIPQDMSSAAFLLAAAMVTRSSITLEGMTLCAAGLANEQESVPSNALANRQVDALLFSLAQSAGVHFLEKGGDLLVDARAGYSAMGEVDLSGAIDLVPILSVIASFAKKDGTHKSTVLKGIDGARNKECDRVEACLLELTKAGVSVFLQQSTKGKGERLEIFPSQETQKRVSHNSYQDHRMAMAMAVRSLVTGGLIKDPQCYRKTYPTFLEDLNSLSVDGKRVCDLLEKGSTYYAKSC